jgi:hypothetical protein
MWYKNECLGFKALFTKYIVIMISFKITEKVQISNANGFKNHCFYL